MSLGPLILAVFALGALAITLGYTAEFALVCLFGSIVVYPAALFRFEGYVPHFGISAGSPTIFGYTAVLFCFVFMGAAMGCLPIERSWLPFVVFIAIASIFVWPMNAVRVSGIIHLISGALAAGFSYFLATKLSRDQFQTALVRVILFLSVIEFVVCAAQLFGFPSFIANQFVVGDITAETTAGRIAGTTDHPGTLGKVSFLLIMMCLPLFSVDNVSVRRMAQISTALLAIPLVFSEGRANFAAVVLMFVAWPIVSSIANVGRRRAVASKQLIFSVLAILVAFASFGIYAARFEEDPVGGPRSRLLDVAYEQIGMRFFSGTGPNAYVDVVGQFDSLTSKGWPVHSVPLLAVGELGIIGAILLFVPVLVITVRSVIVLATKQGLIDSAVVWLSALPGLTIISVTGWGFLSGSMFILVGFVVGVFSARVVVHPGSEQDFISGAPDRDQIKSNRKRDVSI